MESLDLQLSPQPKQLSEMVIGSVDTLRGTEISQVIPITWNDQPPLLDKVGRNGVMVKETETLLKGMIRQGIPPALRCAVQLSNIVQTVHPHLNSEYWYEYRTLAKVRALDYAYNTLLLRILNENTKSSTQSSYIASSSSTILDEISSSNVALTDKKFNPIWETMESLSYGRPETRAVQKVLPATPSGRLAVKRVLMAFEQCIGIEYAPLVPILTSILHGHARNGTCGHLLLSLLPHRACCVLFRFWGYLTEVASPNGFLSR
jgi:hypothetical protein